MALGDGLGHVVGGALARLIQTAWGFSAAFLVMAITGVVTGALILSGIRATRVSLQTAAAT